MPRAKQAASRARTQADVKAPFDIPFITNTIHRPSSDTLDKPVQVILRPITAQAVLCLHTDLEEMMFDEEGVKHLEALSGLRGDQ